MGHRRRDARGLLRHHGAVDHDPRRAELRPRAWLGLATGPLRAPLSYFDLPRAIPAGDLADPRAQYLFSRVLRRGNRLARAIRLNSAVRPHPRRTSAAAKREFLSHDPPKLDSATTRRAGLRIAINVVGAFAHCQRRAIGPFDFCLGHPRTARIPPGPEGLAPLPNRADLRPGDDEQFRDDWVSPGISARIDMD